MIRDLLIWIWEFIRVITWYSFKILFTLIYVPFMAISGFCLGIWNGFNEMWLK